MKKIIPSRAKRPYLNRPHIHPINLSGLSICFDLDGTLVDTAPDLIRVLNEVIATDGLEATDFHAARRHVGFGAARLIREAYIRAGRNIDETQLKNLLNMFLTLYAKDIARLSRPFIGVPDILRYLKHAGARLSVCTNKPGYMARSLLPALKLDRYFDRIIGSRDDIPTKPSPEHIFAAAGHRQSDRIIMVGDALPDVLAARNAGVPVIIMAYGYADMALPQLRADQIIRRFRDLPEAILTLRR